MLAVEYFAALASADAGFVVDTARSLKCDESGGARRGGTRCVDAHPLEDRPINPRRSGSVMVVEEREESNLSSLCCHI